MSDILKNLKHTYIFKEFTGAHAYNVYTKERTAFNHLRSSQQLGKTIIGYYGSFSQDETHILILEYADRGTLDEFLQALDPPSQGPEVMKLWKSLLAVQHALYYIHDIPTATSNLTHETKEFSALRGYVNPYTCIFLSIYANPAQMALRFEACQYPGRRWQYRLSLRL